VFVFFDRRTKNGEMTSKAASGWGLIDCGTIRVGQEEGKRIKRGLESRQSAWSKEELPEKEGEEGTCEEGI